MNSRKTLGLLLLAALGAVACGRSPAWTRAQLVGSWDLQRIDFRGGQSPLEGPPKGYMTLNQDGSFAAMIAGMTPAHTPLNTPYQGTWSLADRTLTTQVKSITARSTLAREGNWLVMNPEDSPSFTFYYAKKP